MNLKEAFRHLSHMDVLLADAQRYITDRANALNVVRNHLCSKANKDATDYQEPVPREGAQFKCDDVIRFMSLIVDEREKLAKAVTVAKASAMLGVFDIDAMTETNKARREFAKSLRNMLQFNESTRKEKGTGYQFNVEGNQMPYTYDIEVVTTAAFNREAAKKTLRELLQEADEVSQQIDALKVNTEVKEYPAPVFDVNEGFADAMETFLAKHPAEPETKAEAPNAS